MRNTSPRVDLEKSREENAPVELYRIYLDELTLYLTPHSEPVDFFDENGAPVTYLPVAIMRSAIKTDVTMRVDECTVSLDNVTKEMSAYVAHTDLRGKRLEILKVFLNLLDDPNDAVVLFDGLIDAPAVSQTEMTVIVRSRLDTLEVITPRRRYRRLCNWQFGSAECGINLADVTVYGTVQGVSSDGQTLTLSGRTEPKNYFVDGVLSVGRHEAVVMASDGATIRVDFPFPPSVVGENYSLRRGCNKTYDESCVGRFGNGARFGGFLSVPTDAY